MNELESIFPEGRWFTEEEFQIRCPFCGDKDTHFHCSININKKYFHCWLCDEKGTLSKLLQYVKINRSLGLGDYVYRQRENIIKKDLIDFDKFLSITGQTSPFNFDFMAKEYLKKRGLTEEDIQGYGIRYADTGKFAGYVIIPIFGEYGEVVCFVARSFVPRKKLKYLYPSKGESLKSKSQVMFQPRLGYRSVVIVEGVFDAFGVLKKLSSVSIAAILGKSMSDEQRNILWTESDLDAHFFIMLDADAFKDEIKVAKTLNGGYNRFRKIFICKLSQGDPGSATSEEIQQAFMDAKEF